jgi:hypothetical protein
VRGDSRIQIKSIKHSSIAARSARAVAVAGGYIVRWLQRCCWLHGAWLRWWWLSTATHRPAGRSTN